MEKGEDVPSIKYLIEKALRLLYRYEGNALISITPNGKKIKKHVGERAIVFRFGIYFQRYLNKYKYYKQFDLDCEYNRSGTDIKKIKVVDRIFPDIILHQRGNNDNNIVVIEFKGWWNKNQKYDEKKVLEMIDPDGDYKYNEGYTVLLERDKAIIKQIFLVK